MNSVLASHRVHCNITLPYHELKLYTAINTVWQMAHNIAAASPTFSNCSGNRMLVLQTIYSNILLLISPKFVHWVPSDNQWTLVQGNGVTPERRQAIVCWINVDRDQGRHMASQVHKVSTIPIPLATWRHFCASVNEKCRLLSKSRSLDFSTIIDTSCLYNFEKITRR